MACTICNDGAHFVDQCEHFRQMGPKEAVRVLLVERARLPTVFTEDKSVFVRVLYLAARHSLGLPFAPWGPKAVQKMMKEGKWHGIAEKYEATLDVGHHEDDPAVEALGRDVLARVVAQKKEEERVSRASQSATPAQPVGLESAPKTQVPQHQHAHDTPASWADDPEDVEGQQARLEECWRNLNHKWPR
ncbi:hypothetical protein JDV02_009911 [Purpureocillium takamizusanense]|uniref:Uncharacterized protein n=1 Tax=Purpureocillium takamizusanense TaxID=2060973 RepID=A0A9Q8VG05_9HYPO|nr:uncharacterized protein JDV02_009911 [Purpureocillium takamizusanense]UNI24138.1 hypothetical protein JDV02_009911 [Purpureocillium takamizusanense]